jgi:hypothetical protein
MDDLRRFLSKCNFFDKIGNLEIGGGIDASDTVLSKKTAQKKQKSLTDKDYYLK